MKTRRLVALLALFVLTTLPLHATNGYFTLGYGTAYRGMAGAGVAMHLNNLASATNPAVIAFVKGYDVSVNLFNPNREYTVTGNPSGYPGTFGLMPGTFESDSSLFVMPGLSGAWHLSDRMHLGVALYGNGGMNTDYPYPTFGSAPTGVNLMQAFVAPSFAYEVAKNHAIGISVIGAWQSFEAKGLGAFAMFSSAPTKLSNNGADTALGWGVRIGYQGDVTDWLAVGASYQSRIWMGRFDDYAGLFAEQGSFDIPETWMVGIAVKPTICWTIAVDVQQINYSSIKSIGNPMLPNLMTARLGDEGGAGFGWRDMTVVKVGAQYDPGNSWTFRAGYSYGRQPIPESEVLFNILAPGVEEQHAAVGVSKVFGKSALHLAVTRAFSKSIEGPNPLEAPGQQRIKLTMDQWEGELGFSFGF